MSRKIKFHLFTTLYRFFAFLADKSGGWRLFTEPKLLFGSFIIGLSASSLAQAQEPVEKQKNKLQTQTTTDTISQKDYDGEIICYVIIETQPEFPGGTKALMDFIDSVKVYPQEAIEKKIEGRVICNFVIEHDGSVTDVQVVRGVHPLLDAEAIRVISSMPKWKPGMQLNTIVRVRFTLPIRFDLEKNN